MRMARLTWGVVAAAALGVAAPAVGQQADVMERPVFTPFTKKPELRSAVETREVLRAMYPPMLREAGIGGTAVYWLFIDRTGDVRKAELYRSSGYDELDAAAGRVAEEMKFTPALNRDRAVDVWVQVPIAFSAENRAPAARERRAAAGAVQGGDSYVTAAPTFTPYTEAPELTNHQDVARALQVAYPPLLRDAGIGGTAQVWFLIDEDGSVVKTQVARSSGHDALDRAALSVAQAMRFHPARNGGDDVMVWVQVPVTFASK
jgi:TonB family protein